MSDLVSIRDRARFRRPTIRTGIIPRSRLEERYASADGRVLRVLAPAGNGKSTQVRRWVGDDDRTIRWLDLEAIDNDPLVLAHAIAAELTDRSPVAPVAENVPFDDLAELIAELGCLERFSGAMCDAVLDRADAAATLRSLCRSELMLIGLDEHDEWYRMHAVLARWLSSRLRSVDPVRWRQIHVAAARWWSSEGDADVAIEHAAPISPDRGDADESSPEYVRAVGTIGPGTQWGENMKRTHRGRRGPS